MIMLLRVTGLGGDTLWPHRVVLATPAFDQDLYFGQRVEDLTGERFMRPEFGSRLKSLVFEANLVYPFHREPLQGSAPRQITAVAGK